MTVKKRSPIAIGYVTTHALECPHLVELAV